MDVARHQVCEARRVPDHDQLRFVTLVTRQGVRDLRAHEPDGLRVTRPRVVVFGTAPQYELFVVAALDRERSADDLVLGQRPVGAVPFDRVPWLGPAVGAVHDGHEGRGGGGEPGLDRPVVEGPDTVSAWVALSG